MAGRVRQAIDQAALEQYISQNIPEIKLPIKLNQFGFGQSNPTYQVTDRTSTRFVLRKKPPGKLLSKSAHKVEREYRILSALAPTDVPVPRTFSLCEDASILGTPFYVMEFLDGRIFEDFAMPGVSPTDRAAMWQDAIETLAKFHRINPQDVGLGDFGKRGGFYKRQIATWTGICEKQAAAKDVETGEIVGKLPHMDELMEFFKNEKRQPKDRVSFVHGDYKIDNLVFHKTEPRVIGILDWEMSTIGNPLSDLCNFLTQFALATQRRARYNPAFLPGATQGLPSLDQIIGWYAGTAGFNPTEDLSWAMSFNIFRLAAITHGIAARYAARQASSEKAQLHAQERGPLAEFAWELARNAGAGEVASKL